MVLFELINSLWDVPQSADCDTFITWIYYTVAETLPDLDPSDKSKLDVLEYDDIKGNVVKVNFGDPNMKIKKNIPGRRKSFRARHNCDNPGPRWKARYWSCRAW